MLTSTTNISCQAVGPYLKSVHNCIHCALVVYFISQKYVFKKLTETVGYIGEIKGHLSVLKEGMLILMFLNRHKYTVLHVTAL